VALPGAYAPANITLQVIEVRKLPLHDKAAVFEEVFSGLNGVISQEIELFILNIILLKS
jgi:hypothetical protein